MSTQRLNLENNIPKRIAINECSVFTYPWKWNTWRGFWRNIAQFFDNLGAAWQRATKGYCVGDIWNLDYSVINYLINTLTEYRNTTVSWPDRLTFETYEEWIDYIDHIIDELEFARADRDEYNEYAAAYHAMGIKPYNQYTDEEKLLLGNYIDRDAELYRKQQSFARTAIIRLAEHLDDMWI